MDSNQWLAQVREEIIDPDLPICDPHHHLWDHPDNPYLIEEIAADLGDGHHVVSTVFMECMSMYRANGSASMAPVGETEFVQGIAAMSASGGYGDAQIAAAIVGFADLTLGDDVRPVLEAHIAASPNRFSGIRHATSWHQDREIRNAHTRPTEKLSETEAFRRGFAVLADMGQTFDVWCFHDQISEVASLALAFPDTTIVLDHFGGPLGVGPYRNKRDEVFADWQKNIDSLAKLDNVHFKLGGINMKINGFDWHKRDLPPTSDELVAATGAYYDHCIDIFGAHRCMFESNFPVDKESCSYHVLYNAFKKISRNCSSEDIGQLFHDTAVRVYGVE
ncbi:MAG: putative TIM-barrel fold metal-dependent hydrolase [Candidatus Azotimanducaceae bacterium]|jgi:predicted TIM-barrel fold metal-dependent hydrolase